MKAASRSPSFEPACAAHVFFYTDYEYLNQPNEVGSTMWADDRYVALETETDDVFLQGGQETVVIVQP